MALTKLDILADLKELKICYAYEHQGEIINEIFQGLDLHNVKPLYKDLKPFPAQFEELKSNPNLLSYIHTIEKFLEIPVSIMAYGPEREQILFKESLF